MNYLRNIRQVLMFFFQHFEKNYLKHSLDSIKCSIKIWNLDIFPVFTCKNQNCTENQSI